MPNDNGTELPLMQARWDTGSEVEAPDIEVKEDTAGSSPLSTMSDAVLRVYGEEE